MSASRTILVVDDESPVRRLVARLLDGPDYEVIGASGGAEALALAAERRPDLILLDVNMPWKTGYEVLAALRRGARTLTIPVILLTGESRASDKADGLALGADDYVTKPFAAAELRARVDALLLKQALRLP